METQQTSANTPESSTKVEPRSKRGVLVFNLGGPTTVKDVKPFLYELFSDPNILVSMPTLARKSLAFLISQTKGRNSEKMYEAIGGGSPQLKWTETQVKGLESRIRADETEKTDTRCLVAMRASRPNIDDALKELKSWGADELILFPLFPQFSTTTTGSCFEETERVLKKMSWKPKLKKVHGWPDSEEYIQTFRKLIESKLKEMTEKGADPVYVLFSAHSLPMKIIERGDPYPSDVNRTVQALSQDLKQEWSLAFQSRNGPVPWLKPYTEDEISRLAKEGVKSMLVVPISFVSDHIETLFEIDVEYKELAHKNGIQVFERTDSFNDRSDFMDALHAIYKKSLLPRR